jgi:glycosyltransferase involved in cell wall biosynthesis
VLPDAALGGAHAMNFRLADALNTRGWHVDIAFLFDRHSTQHYQQVYPAVGQRSMGCRSLTDRISLPFRLGKVAADYDLVMAGLDLAATNYSYLASRLAKKPFLAWMHIAFNEHMHTASWFARTFSISIYRRVRMIVFPSRGARASLISAIDKQPTDAQWPVVQNFTESSVAAPLTKTTIVEHILSKPVLINIGRLAPQKALDRLVRAHARLLQQGIEHHLVFVGDGPQRGELEAAAVAAGVSATTFFLGHLANPRSWLRNATVFALCSRYEGLPLVLLEALQEGVPIVSMDCPSGPSEILEGGAVGLLTPAEDEAAFQAALAKLLLSPALCTMYAQLGRERARFYSPERVIPIWESLLEEAIGHADHHRADCQPPTTI